MTVQSGLLRMDTPGGGHIVNITPGVESVLRNAKVERGLGECIRHWIDRRDHHDGV